MRTQIIGPGKDRSATTSRIYVKREAQNITGDLHVPIAGVEATLEADGDYLIEAVIPYTTTTGGLFGVEGAADGVALVISSEDNAGLAARKTITSLPTTQITGSFSGDAFIHVRGTLLGATGGNFKITASQEDKDAENPLIVLAGGYLRVTKLN